MIPKHIQPSPGHSAYDTLINLREERTNSVEYNGQTFTVKPKIGGWLITRQDGKQCTTDGSPTSYTDILGACAYLAALE